MNAKKKTLNKQPKKKKKPKKKTAEYMCFKEKGAIYTKSGKPKNE